MLGVRWLNLVERVRESLWFLPGVMALCAAGLAFLTVWVDVKVPERWVQDMGWVYSGGASGASAVLGTVASSIVTIMGVVFSMTLVALSLASTQFGPRILRNFMRDRSNQAVLGVFVATFLYNLLVLRTIRRETEGEFVPRISVTVGVAMALASVGVLIYFIHHVSVSIQADEIIGRVNRELMQGMERLYPERMGEGAAEKGGEAERLCAGEGRAIGSEGDGYVQVIDPEQLVSAAEKWDVVVRVERRPGQYVSCGEALARCWPLERGKEELVVEVRRAFGVGDQRTPQQDVEFAVLQLVEIAVRALSPGVNDPFTAITCVDRLGSALRRLAEREMPSAERRGKDGKLRVIAAGPTFPRVLEAAFDQIRQNARGSAAVTLRVLEALRSVAEKTTRVGDREAVRRQAEAVMIGAREVLRAPGDLRAAEERYGGVMRELGEEQGGY